MIIAAIPQRADVSAPKRIWLFLFAGRGGGMSFEAGKKEDQGRVAIDREVAPPRIKSCNAAMFPQYGIRFALIISR